MDMAQNIRVFPLAVLGAMLVFGLLVWWAVSRSTVAEKVQRDFDEKPVPGMAVGTKIQPVPLPKVEAPPPARDPGEKILEGADGAYDKGMWETSLKFYKDFELWYAGTPTWTKNMIRVFERIHTSGAKMPKQDPELGQYLDARRRAAEDWRGLQPFLAGPPTDVARLEVTKYLKTLPPKDGRIARIEAWLSPAKQEK